MNEKLKWRLGLVMAALATALLVVGLRRTPSFAATVELPLYDYLTVRLWPWKPQAASPVVLVTMSDEAFWRGLNDANLADLLERLGTAAPSVIAVDLIRDKPLPPGTDRLASLVTDQEQRETTILMAAGIPGLGGIDGFSPPQFLGNQDLIDAHVGLAVMPEDSPGRPMVRRGLAAVHGGTLLSMPAQAALAHLAFRNPQRLEMLMNRLETIASLPPTAGGYVEKHEAGNQFLLKPFPNMRSHHPVIAAEHIATMDEATLRSSFTGKVVFIGTEANLGQDEKPVSGNPDLRGVRLLACTTDQLIRELDTGEDPVGWFPDRQEDLAVLVAAAACTLACSVQVGPLVLRILTIIPLLSAAWLALGGWSLVDGWWFPSGAPLAATLISGTLTHSLMFVRERKDRQTMFSLLEKHLSPEVAAAVWEHNEALLKDKGPPPEMIHATALFADLKGYSGITESFEKSSRNREFIAWLNTYLQAVIPVVRKEGGFVQQFAGDGIFVIFGFPGGKDDAHALNAVRCARGIAEIIAGLNHRLDPGLPPYHARIGIYTGDIICATVGDKNNASYSFFGSTINKAARLESIRKQDHAIATEPVRILISDPTRTAVGEAVPISPFGEEPIQLDPNLPPERVWKIF